MLLYFSDPLCGVIYIQDWNNKFTLIRIGQSIYKHCKTCYISIGHKLAVSKWAH